MDNLEGQAGSQTPDLSAVEGGAAPKLVDFEFDGEKLQVPEAVATKLKSGVMAHADYTRKMQGHAESKRAFEEDQRTAMALNQVLEDNPEMMEVVSSLVNGDRQKAKELLEEENPNDSNSKLENRLNQLERKFQTKSTNDARSQTMDAYFSEARKTHPDFDKYADKMAMLLSQKNPAVPVYLAATLEDRVNEAKEIGRKEGLQEAYKDFENRLMDTPPIGGAGGDVSDYKDNSTEAVAARTLAKMRQQGM